MSNFPRFIFPLGILAALLLTPSGAPAQEVGVPPVPIVEVSGGYAFLRDTTGDESVPRGWLFSSAFNANDWLGLVGEVSGAHKTFDDNFFSTMKLSQYTFMGGPRFFRQFGRVVPFGQFLLGVAHFRMKQTVSIGDEGDRTFSDSETRWFAIQPGGGVTVNIAPHVGVRGAFDYRQIVWWDGDDEQQFRVTAGFVFGWGAR